MTINMNAQIRYGLYETIDTSKSSGVKEIMIKISNDVIELYTLPNAYNIGGVTANKGRIVEEENGTYVQIDTTWIFSSNYVHLTNLRINCMPKSKIEFNKDSTLLNFKFLDNARNSESFESDSSEFRIRMICGCIEDYQELNFRKVDYFQNEFDWNCGSYKYWKRGLKHSKITNCSN